MNKNFTGKKVLIMGLGLLGGGVGAARFFVEQDAAVTVTDLRPESQLRPSLEKLSGLPIRFVLGKHRQEDIVSADLVLRNPAVPSDSPYLTLARKRGIPVEMEAALFVKLVGRRDVIGVTGTRGKTTTTMMIADIFRMSGRNVAVGGNVSGVSTLSLLPSITTETVVVLELSSWQLQGFDEAHISPDYAVITNIFPDHLNRYRSMEAYVEDKRAIFRYQDQHGHLFVNSDNEYTPLFVSEAHGAVHRFSAQDCPVELSLVGDHNRANAAAASAVARVLDVPESATNAALASFDGVPYRMQEIAVVDDVSYVNDTTSTMPEATMAALASISSPIILIAGGADKGLAYGNLGDLIDRRVKYVVLLEGSGTGKLESAIKRREKILGKVSSMKEAVSLAREHVESGDVVLLSPAFASFGLFQHEFERGDQFNRAVLA